MCTYSYDFADRDKNIASSPHAPGSVFELPFCTGRAPYYYVVNAIYPAASAALSLKRRPDNNVRAEEKTEPCNF